MKFKFAVLLLLHIFTTFTLRAEDKIKISGYIRDIDNNPLELVNVHIKNKPIGTMSNEKGFYSLSVTPEDSMVVVFSCIGYNKAERILPQVTSDFRLNVKMRPFSFNLGEITVTEIKKQTNSMTSIDAGKIRLLPDPSGGTIESLVVTYAGVSSNNELSSQYSVRGGSFDENIVYVNGMEVYRPLLIKSGQQEGLSFVNPDMTQSVNFSAGGFEPCYGDKMSSVLDIVYKKPSRLEGSASVSLLGGNIYIGNSTKKFSQITGLRYKTNRSLLSTMDTDAEYDPDFIDFQTYITYKFSPKFELDLLGNIAHNRYQYTPRNRETSFGTTQEMSNFKVYFDGKEKDIFKTMYGLLSLKYKPNSKTNLDLKLSAFNSNETESYDISGEYWLNDGESEDENLSISRATGVYHEHTRNKLHARIINVEHSGTKKIYNNTLKWGASIQFESFSDRINEWEKRDSAGYSLPHTGNGVNLISNLYSNNNLNSARTAFYIQDAFKFRINKGLFTLTGGIRGSYWNYNKEFIVSPRLSLGFIPNFNQNLTFRLAGGLYYQAPFYKELRLKETDQSGNNNIILNDKIKSQQSIHAILGGDYTFKIANRNFKITTELYYKKLNKLIPYTVDNVKIRYYGRNCAQGYAMGIDFKFFGEFVPGIDSWISFSLMKAEQTIDKQFKVPLPNSQGYNLSLYFQDYFPGYKRLKLNLKGIVSGGLPITPSGKGYEFGYFRTPTYKRIDMGLSFQLAGGDDPIMDRGFFRNLKNIWIGADVFNLFDFKNTNSYYWITRADNKQAAVPNYLTGRQFNIRLIINF